MKDIFEILQHEGHKLELIKHGNEYLLGCKTCGKTLLTRSFVIENVEEYATILDTLKYQDKNEKLYDNVKQLGKYILEIKDPAIKYMQEIAIGELLSLKKKDHFSITSKVRHIFNIKDLISEVYANLYCIENYRTLISTCYSEDDWETEVLAIKERLLFALRQKMIPTHKFYNDHQETTFGCTTYKLDTNDKKYKFFAIDKELAQELETKYPTPTDEYRFEDIDDFYRKEPSWEDEEEENMKFKEYMYRIQNDLYDFTNIDPDIIIKNAIQFYSEYELIERHVIPLKKMLKERYNIQV